MVLIAGHVNEVVKSIQHGFKAFIPVVILLVYTFFGALIFMAIEGPNEEYQMELDIKKREVITQVGNISAKFV